MKVRRLRRNVLAILMWGPLLLESAGTAGSQPAGQAGPAPVAQSFGELKGRIPRGASVFVTDSTGHELSGKVAALSDTSLDLLSDGRTHAFSQADVGLIKVRQRDSLWNGLIIGAVAGVAPAVYWLFADPNECGGSICMVDLLTGVIPSAAIGLAIDAAVQKKVVVFRSPSRLSSSGRTALTVAPIVGQRRKGVELTVSF
jgi:hypothetical protein